MLVFRYATICNAACSQHSPADAKGAHDASNGTSAASNKRSQDDASVGAHNNRKVKPVPVVCKLHAG